MIVRALCKIEFVHSNDVSSKIQKHIFFEAYVEFLAPEVRARTSWSTRNNKDEVRELGVKLGIPAPMLYRHPFPGPGLGVRILGSIGTNNFNTHIVGKSLHDFITLFQA
jgi:hypothetical protein